MSMRLSSLCALLLLAACMSEDTSAPPLPDTGPIAAAPALASGFACADGREVQISVPRTGRIILTLDGAAVEMPEVVGDPRGDFYQAGTLGWISTPDWQGELVEIGPGQDVYSAPTLACTRTGPMPEAMTDFVFTDPAYWIARCDDGRNLTFSYYPESGVLTAAAASWSLFEVEGEPAGEEHWQGEGVTLIWRDRATSADLIESLAGGGQRMTHCDYSPD